MKETGQHEYSCWQTSLAPKRIVQMIWEGILPDARCTRSDAVRSRLRPGVTVPGALLLCTQPSLGCSEKRVQQEPLGTVLQTSSFIPSRTANST